MKINRSDILISVLETVETISNKDYQRRIWIEGKGPEVDDFDEACCNFFGDGNPLIQNHKAFGITEAQYQILKDFRNVFRAFSNEHYSPEEFIDTAEWAEIVKMADKVLKAFDYTRTLPDKYPS